jgi:hypothetical protein
MPSLVFGRTNVQGTQFVFEARIPHTQFVFQFPGANYQQQVQSARAFVAEIDGSDLTAAEVWIFNNLAANPLNPAAAWTQAEAIAVMRSMMICDSFEVMGQAALLVDAFALQRGVFGAYDTLGEVIESADGDAFLTLMEALVAAA